MTTLARSLVARLIRKGWGSTVVNSAAEGCVDVGWLFCWCEKRRVRPRYGDRSPVHNQAISDETLRRLEINDKASRTGHDIMNTSRRRGRVMRGNPSSNKHQDRTLQYPPCDISNVSDNLYPNSQDGINNLVQESYEVCCGTLLRCFHPPCTS